MGRLSQVQSLTQSDELAGIIGGTGPEATNFFANLLVKLRGHVKRDQDHIPYLLFNNPQIPDRSKYLLYGGESPIPEMVKTGLLLKQAGATFLIIPCNTAHAFVEEVENGVGIPVMNMIEETARYISHKYGDDATVGLLATSGTVQSKIYHNMFSSIAPNVKLIVPNEKSQENVMKACYEIKKFSSDENSFALLDNAAKELLAQGAKAVILGCTEIPLALNSKKCGYACIDPMTVLAKKVITRTFAGAKIQKQKTERLTLQARLER